MAVMPSYFTPPLATLFVLVHGCMHSLTTAAGQLTVLLQHRGKMLSVVVIIWVHIILVNFNFLFKSRPKVGLHYCTQVRI